MCAHIFLFANFYYPFKSNGEPVIVVFENLINALIWQISLINNVYFLFSKLSRII